MRNAFLFYTGVLHILTEVNEISICSVVPSYNSLHQVEVV